MDIRCGYFRRIADLLGRIWLIYGQRSKWLRPPWLDVRDRRDRAAYRVLHRLRLATSGVINALDNLDSITRKTSKVGMFDKHLCGLFVGFGLNN